MIPIEQSNDLKPLTLLYPNEFSRIYRTNDGRLLKQVSNYVLKEYSKFSINYEEKILNSDSIIGMYALAKPLTAVYNGKNFIGYTMYTTPGIDYREFQKGKSMEERCNLYFSANVHRQMEDIVRRGNEQSMVFPDLASSNNIFIDEKERISLIDFDGMQYGKYGSLSISDTLGLDVHLKPKYSLDGVLFNSELDKLSLMMFYFLDAFNVNLSRVGTTVADKVLTLKDIFEFIGLEGEETLYNKVEATLSDHKKGVFLGDEVDRIAREYRVVPYVVEGAQTFGKKLIKKAS